MTSHVTVRWIEQNFQRVSMTLKIHGLMKDDKVLELLIKLDDVLLRKDIPWDEIHDEQIENVKNNSIRTYLIKEMVKRKIIRAGSTGSITNGFLERLNEHTKMSFLKTKSKRDSVFYG